jgi:hypothetical protein
MPQLGPHTPWVIRDKSKPRRDGLLTEFTRPLGFYSREDANVYRNTCLSAERASYHDVVHIDDINKETAR